MVPIFLLLLHMPVEEMENTVKCAIYNSVD